MWAELKDLIIFDISEFDYVGFILKIDHFGLLRAKNRLFPVKTGNAWAGLKGLFFEIRSIT